MRLSSLIVRPLLAAALAAPFASAPALAAQAESAVQPSEALVARAADLVRLFKGEAQPGQIFTPAFLAQVPEAQVAQINAQIVGQAGQAEGVNRIEPVNPHEGRLFVDFERATLHLDISVQPEAPHLIQGLRVTGGTPR